MDPVYGYEVVNVEAQTERPVVAAELDAQHDRAAQAVPGLRARHARIPEPRQPKDPGLPAARTRSETVLCVANLSRFAQPVELDLSGFEGMVPVEMLGYVEFPVIGPQRPIP